MSARRGMVMQLQRCSCTDHRPVASARQLRSSRCERVSKTTGGLRPPLLCCDANVCRRKNDFCDAQTHIRPRAAGVSPPWFGFALATATVYFRLSALARHDRFPHHGGLTPPAAMRTSFGEKRFLQCTNAHPTRAAKVRPPWFGFALQRRAVFATTAMQPSASRVSKTTAGLRQPLLVHARLFLQNCDARQRVAPVPRLAHASRSWGSDPSR
jgi:hypothetical protein